MRSGVIQVVGVQALAVLLAGAALALLLPEDAIPGAAEAAAPWGAQAPPEPLARFAGAADEARGVLAQRGLALLALVLGCAGAALLVRRERGVLSIWLGWATLPGFALAAFLLPLGSLLALAIALPALVAHLPSRRPGAVAALGILIAAIALRDLALPLVVAAAVLAEGPARRGLDARMLLARRTLLGAAALVALFAAFLAQDPGVAHGPRLAELELRPSPVPRCCRLLLGALAPVLGAPSLPWAALALALPGLAALASVWALLRRSPDRAVAGALLAALAFDCLRTGGAPGALAPLLLAPLAAWLSARLLVGLGAARARPALVAVAALGLPLLVFGDALPRHLRPATAATPGARWWLDAGQRPHDPRVLRGEPGEQAGLPRPSADHRFVRGRGPSEAALAFDLRNGRGRARVVSLRLRPTLAPVTLPLLSRGRAHLVVAGSRTAVGAAFSVHPEQGHWLHLAASPGAESLEIACEGVELGVSQVLVRDLPWRVGRDEDGRLRLVAQPGPPGLGLEVRAEPEGAWSPATSEWRGKGEALALRSVALRQGTVLAVTQAHGASLAEGVLRPERDTVVHAAAPGRHALRLDPVHHAGRAVIFLPATAWPSHPVALSVAGPRGEAPPDGALELRWESGGAVSVAGGRFALPVELAGPAEIVFTGDRRLEVHTLGFHARLRWSGLRP